MVYLININIYSPILNMIVERSFKYIDDELYKYDLFTRAKLIQALATIVSGMP